MSVLAVVTERDQNRSFLAWALTIAEAKQERLVVLCWSYEPSVKFPLLAENDEFLEGGLAENEALVNETQEVLYELVDHSENGLTHESVEIRRAIEPDLTTATLAEIRAGNHDLVIVRSDEKTQSGGDADFESHPLLRRSPCETIVLCRTREFPAKAKRILVLATDSPHDQAAFEAFSEQVPSAKLRLTFARLEDEAGAEATELGRRELKRLLRAAGVKSSGRVKSRVFPRDSWQEFLDTADQQNLVLVGADQKDLIRNLQDRTSSSAIAIIKREPRFTRFSPWHHPGRVTSSRWKTKLSPADYADLMQGLRRGADLNADFLIMLGLAAAIASLGLLQDSPAVVIGSMLLAPLMTPMISCGLAIAQGNKKLGRRSMVSIAAGFLLTLAVSFVLGIGAPGEELTPQIMARGNPNILDLLIALFSAAAAAYALARPSIVGAIAGVAIATALVPPLCSIGISLAYRDYLSAHGAAILFATNLVAIILGAAVTFRMLGVTVSGIDTDQRRWVYRITTVICVTLIILAYPLQRRLHQRIDQGQSQPRTYPLTKATDEALVDFLQRSPDIELVSSGRPSTVYDRADVVLVLSSPEPLPHSFADELIEICRQQMEDPELEVEVHCFLDAWGDGDE